MSFEAPKINQYGYTTEEWDMLPDEVRNKIVSENSTSVEITEIDDCCIPRAVGARVLELSDAEQQAEEDLPELTVNDRANALLPKVRILTDREESRIDTLFDTGQCSLDDAYRRVTGYPLSAYSGEISMPFNFVSSKAIELASQILDQPHPRLNKNLRPSILKFAIVDKNGHAQISQTEAEDLMRLIEILSKR